MPWRGSAGRLAPLIPPEGAQHQPQQQSRRVVEQAARLQQQVAVGMKAQAGVNLAFLATHLEEAVQGTPSPG